MTVCAAAAVFCSRQAAAIADLHSRKLCSPDCRFIPSHAATLFAPTEALVSVFMQPFHAMSLPRGPSSAAAAAHLYTDQCHL